MLEELGASRNLRLVGADAADDFLGLVDCVVGPPGLRCVVATTSDGDAYFKPALLAGVDRVDQPVASAYRRPAALIDGIVGLQQFGEVLRQPAEAIGAARFLVTTP